MNRFALLLALLAPLPAAAADGFHAHGNISWGYGRMGRGDEGSTPNRAVNTLGLHLAPGYRFGDFIPALRLGLHRVGQNTAPADAANTNLRGHGWSVGPMVAYEGFDRLSLTAGLTLAGRHSLSELTPEAEHFRYQSALGFHLGGHYRLHPERPFLVGLNFEWTRYKKRNVNKEVEEFTLHPNKHWNLAVVATYELGAKRSEPKLAEQPAALVETAQMAEQAMPSSPGKNLAAEVGGEQEGDEIVVRLSGASSFPPYQSEPAAQAQAKLRALAAALQEQPKAKVLVEGHADTSGNPARNARLAASRAESVRRFLAKTGLKNELTARGRGSEQPLASNETAEGREQNRRVEIRISDWK